MHYQLHDYEIDSVVLENDSIIFSFPQGFYAVDDQGRETITRNKKLVFHIDTNGFPLESFLEIRRITWGHIWRNISFKQFTSLFQKGNMIIHDEYDSKLTNWKIIQLNACTNWSNIELRITDIDEIACCE